MLTIEKLKVSDLMFIGNKLVKSKPLTELNRLEIKLKGFLINLISLIISFYVQFLKNMLVYTSILKSCCPF